MTRHTKTILITGGSSGLGKHLALALAAMDYKVFVTVRDHTNINDFEGSDIHCLIMDVCNAASIDSAFRELNEKHKITKLDVLINNAGIVVPGPLEILSEKEIKEQFDVNVFGVIRVIQKFLPLLKTAHGKIINIGSMSSRMALPFVGVYGASKSSLKQISWAFRLELKTWKIQVCHFELGNFDSSIWQKSINKGKKISDQRYNDVMENMLSLMENRADNFNAFGNLLRKIQKTIENKNAKFNTIVGRDAYFRKVITTLLPYSILENSLFKKFNPKQK